jgi:transcriptional regulator with XRE-family HTH domain
MPTPTTRKKQLGYALKYLREQAGLNQEQAGKLIKKPQNRIADIEKGVRGIAYGDLILLLNGYGVSDDERVGTLTELNQNTSQRGRWSGYRAVYPEQFRMVIDLEEDSDLIRMVSAEVIPGVLQCEQYIRALYADRPFYESALTLEDLVRSRLARQEIFTKPDGPQLLVVMSESSLRRRQGNGDVMRTQIDHMLTLSRLPNVQIQVLPFDSPADTGGFICYRFSMLRIPSPGIAGPMELVYINQLVDDRYLEDTVAISMHDRLWHKLSAAALGPEDSRELMRGVASDL